MTRRIHARSQAWRVSQGDAAGGDCFHHRRSGLDGHAAVFRIYRRVPDLYGRVGNQTLDRDRCGDIHRDHRILYYPHYRQVFFGAMPEEFEGHVHDVTVLDKVALVFLSAILMVVGVYPAIMVPLVESGVQTILRLLGGA